MKEKKASQQWTKKGGVICFSIILDGIKTDIVVLTARALGYIKLTNSNIRNVAKRDYLVADPNLKIAHLIREKFSNNEIAEMGLERIVVMHEPVDSRLFVANIYYSEYGYRMDSVEEWRGGSGFAFISTSKTKKAIALRRVFTFMKIIAWVAFISLMVELTICFPLVAEVIWEILRVLIVGFFWGFLVFMFGLGLMEMF